MNSTEETKECCKCPGYESVDTGKSELKKLEDELIGVAARIEVLESEQKALEERRKQLSDTIREQWLLSDTTGKTRNGFNLELKLIERWSIPGDQVDSIEELFQQAGLADKIKHYEAYIHPAAFNSALKKMVDPEGEFKYQEDDLLKKFPAINVFRDTYIEVKKKKKI